MITNKDKNRTALIFIEFQEEWIGKEARLKNLLVKDLLPFEQAVKNAGHILMKARQAGWGIAHAGLDLRQDPDYLLFGRGVGKRGLSGAIPRAKTWTATGAEFVAPFVPEPREFCVQGRSGASVLKTQL